MTCTKIDVEFKHGDFSFTKSHRQVREKGGKKASVIVILTDGVLLPPSDRKSFKRTDILKQVISIPFCRFYTEDNIA